jgi:hypothetical protein
MKLFIDRLEENVTPESLLKMARTGIKVLRAQGSVDLDVTISRIEALIRECNSHRQSARIIRAFTNTGGYCRYSNGKDLIASVRHAKNKLEREVHKISGILAKMEKKASKPQ